MLHPARRWKADLSQAARCESCFREMCHSDQVVRAGRAMLTLTEFLQFLYIPQPNLDAVLMAPFLCLRAGRCPKYKARAARVTPVRASRNRAPTVAGNGGTYG
jgi:hypothetical protein